MHRYVKVTEVLSELHIDTDFLRTLESEDLIHLKPTMEGDLVISAEDVDRVRLVACCSPASSTSTCRASR